MMGQAPPDTIPLPMAQGNSEVDEKALRGLFATTTCSQHLLILISMQHTQFPDRPLWKLSSSASLFGGTGKLTVKLPDATLEDYFLKVILCPARGPFF